MPEALLERSLRSTLDSLLEGFQIIGHDWTYLYVNPQAAAQGRRAPDELEGRTMETCYPGIGGTPLFEELQRCMRDRKASAFQNLFAFPDGTSRWFELRIEPVPAGLCIHSIDIHERKGAELALQTLNDELEVRVASRTREMESIGQELEAFAYSVSHDLRAPLRHIAGFAAIVQGSSTSLPEETQRHLTRIQEAAARMSRLIDDLLAFSRVGRAPLHKQSVDLGSLVREVRHEVMLGRDESTVVWNIADLPTVTADPALLRQALINLTGNAVKYSSGRTPAVIDVGTLPESAGEIVVFVRDNGVGFDMQYGHKLFTAFQRLHTDDEFEGTGIGLANVRRIIHRHEGRTWAEGRVGAGATFYFSLPR